MILASLFRTQERALPHEDNCANEDHYTNQTTDKSCTQRRKLVREIKGETENESKHQASEKSASAIFFIQAFARRCKFPLEVSCAKRDESIQM